MPTLQDLEEEIRAGIRARQNPQIPPSPSPQWRWSEPPMPLGVIEDKDLLWQRDILIDIWKRLNQALVLMDSGLIDEKRQVVIIREKDWQRLPWLINPRENITTEYHLQKLGRQDIVDKLRFAGERLKRATVESRVLLPGIPPPPTSPEELLLGPPRMRILEFPLMIRRIVDESRSMVHSGIRILDIELSKRTFTLSSRDEILGIVDMEPLPPDYADVREFGRNLQYAIQATGYDPCYTAQGQKAIHLDLGDRTMGPAKKWAEFLGRKGCQVTSFHGHHPIYHVHAICLYPENKDERDRFLQDLMLDIYETFGPPGPSWFYFEGEEPRT